MVLKSRVRHVGGRPAPKCFLPRPSPLIDLITQSRKILIKIVNSKMAVFYSTYAFYPSYSIYFSYVYTGYYSDPVPAALKAEGAAGGGGPALAAPPPPPQ
jgi:hypothetical protein